MTDSHLAECRQSIVDSLITMGRHMSDSDAIDIEDQIYTYLETNGFLDQYGSMAYNILGEYRNTGILDLGCCKNEYNRDIYQQYKESVRDNNIISQVQVNEGMFKCGKCGCKKCTYYSIQKRSCDEPPTTYVECTNRRCGNRWRFG
jgi:DNA-directed RNA polymerase subunit M/transcription elongation factor TFIIS